MVDNIIHFFMGFIIYFNVCLYVKCKVLPVLFNWGIASLIL